jgi:glutamine amidotransferase
MSKNIVIVDYGMGNIGSIANMLKYLGSSAVISSNKEVIEQADKLILPGVGHFDKAIQNIHNLDLFEVIKYKVLEDQIPILGICLGMQLMCNFSQEGFDKGFSFIDADVIKFDFTKSQNLKVPHMGWNNVDFNKSNSLITNGLEQDARFYFVHSYFVACKDESNILMRTFYGHSFVSAFEQNNIVGVQFHPEKSHKYGIKLFRNFVENF